MTKHLIYLIKLKTCRNQRAVKSPNQENVPHIFSIPGEDATNRAETVVSYFPPMGDNRALTWRIIFAHLLVQTTLGLFVKIGGSFAKGAI